VLTKLEIERVPAEEAVFAGFRDDAGFPVEVPVEELVVQLAGHGTGVEAL